MEKEQAAVQLQARQRGRTQDQVRRKQKGTKSRRLGRKATVRKLLPDSWGFMCPVHTPDGSPCGLLNHLAAPWSFLAKNPFSRKRPTGAHFGPSRGRCVGRPTIPTYPAS